MVMNGNGMSKLTQCLHAAKYVDEVTGGVTMPIYASSSYRVPGPSVEVMYPRYQNLPNQRIVGERIARLENGEAGMVLGSGMAAITAALLSFLKAGDHAVFQNEIYGGTHHFVTSELPRFGIETTMVESTATEDFARAVRENTRLIYIETPTNPLLKIVDLKAVADIARARGVLTVVDNTFATPINQNPLDLGIDIVVHSGTKYLAGHSDLSCGAIVTRAALMEPIREMVVNHGATLNAYDCFLLERGIKTLGVRVRQHNRNGQAVAEFLATHPRVRAVHYPGLPDHPGHAIARQQMAGFGGMLAVDLDCDREGAVRVSQALMLVTPAVSLGAVESLLCFPAETSHAKVSPEERRRQGISDALLRISVGIEETEDLLADFDQALRAI